MKTTLSIFSFVVAFGFLVLLVRSQTRDEGIKYSRYYRVAGNLFDGHSISLGWGEHGIRLFRVLDSGLSKIRREDISREHSLFGGKYKTWSGSYDDVTPWVWPVMNFWNKHDFWYNDNTWADEINNRWRTQITLIAIPLWLPVVFFFSTGVTLFRIRRRVVKQAEQGIAPSDR